MTAGSKTGKGLFFPEGLNGVINGSSMAAATPARAMAPAMAPGMAMPSSTAMSPGMAMAPAMTGRKLLASPAASTVSVYSLFPTLQQSFDTTD